MDAGFESAKVPFGRGGSAWTRESRGALPALISPRMELGLALLESEAHPRFSLDASSGGSKFDDGQVSLAFEIRNTELQPLAFGERVTSGPLSLPLCKRSRWSRVAGGFRAALLRRASVEALVRPSGHVPGDIGIELCLDSCKRQGQDELSKALVFEGAKEPFDDGDAAVLPNSAEARLDVVLATPREIALIELRALVTDDVPGRLPRELDGAIERSANLLGRGLLGENLLFDNRSRAPVRLGSTIAVAGDSNALFPMLLYTTQLRRRDEGALGNAPERSASVLSDAPQSQWIA